MGAAPQGPFCRLTQVLIESSGAEVPPTVRAAEAAWTSTVSAAELGDREIDAFFVERGTGALGEIAPKAALKKSVAASSALKDKTKVKLAALKQWEADESRAGGEQTDAPGCAAALTGEAHWQAQPWAVKAIASK